MDLIDEQRKLSELTEIALENNDIESLKIIESIVNKERLISAANFSEFFYSMVPPDVLNQL
jgi:hypothetical protein